MGTLHYYCDHARREAYDLGKTYAIARGEDVRAVFARHPRVDEIVAFAARPGVTVMRDHDVLPWDDGEKWMMVGSIYNDDHARCPCDAGSYYDEFM